jgi:hypothetical protein
MNWEKKGLIYGPDASMPFSLTHAQAPFAYPMHDRVRVYFATRNQNKMSSACFVDLDPDDLSRVLQVGEQPALTPGGLGMFDESGSMPSWVLPVEAADGITELWMYYTGWNQSETASYRLSVGLAASRDGGLTFERKFVGPLLDRSIHDPVWAGQPCIIREGDLWRMWYLSCTKMESIAGRPEPFYEVKYADSTDGINWNRAGHSCVSFDSFTDAIGRPMVYRDGDLYKMYYSYRNAVGYRTDPAASYRLGYAESADGLSWVRKDEQTGIERSADGWDSQMMQYCHVFRHRDQWVMLYNGNNFGEKGFGYATLPA